MCSWACCSTVLCLSVFICHGANNPTELFRASNATTQQCICWLLPQCQTYLEFLLVASDFPAIITRLMPASGAAAEGPNKIMTQRLSKIPPEGRPGTLPTWTLHSSLSLPPSTLIVTEATGFTLKAVTPPTQALAGTGHWWFGPIVCRVYQEPLPSPAVRVLARRLHQPKSVFTACNPDSGWSPTSTSHPGGFYYPLSLTLLSVANVPVYSARHNSQ